MTEAEWLAAREPVEMLRFLGRRGKVRKRRLFACACVRRIWHLLEDQRSRRAVEVAEAFADGLVDKEMAKCVRRSASAAARLTAGMWSPADAAEICLLLTTEDISTAARAVSAASKAGVPVSSEREAQAALVRDIFGNPFRPVTLPESLLHWQHGTIPNIAQAIYAERGTADRTLGCSPLAVLADALEEAGCTSADLLEHCRQPGEHVRGCWVLDLILGKSQ